MTYTAPLADMRFALREVAGLGKVAELPGYEHATDDTRRCGARGGGQAGRQRARAAQPRGRQGRRQAGERRGAHRAGLHRHLQGIRRRRLELPALRPGIRRPGHAVAPCRHRAGDVAGGQHGLRPGAAAEPGRDRRHPPSRLGRAEGHLPAQDDLRRMDRHHEPHRAAGRLGPRPAQEPRGQERRPLPASPARRSSSPTASTTSPRTSCTWCWRARPTRRPGCAASRCSSCRSSCPSRRQAGQAQRPALRVARAQARHPCQPDLRDELRRRWRRGRLPGRRGRPRPLLHVHHDEQRPPVGRHPGAGDRRARLPAGAPTSPGPACSPRTTAARSRSRCRSSITPTCAAC